jgi:hypothetical protein
MSHIPMTSFATCVKFSTRSGACCETMAAFESIWQIRSTTSKASKASPIHRMNAAAVLLLGDGLCGILAEATGMLQALCPRHGP